MGLYKRKDSPAWWMSFSYNRRQYHKSTGTPDKAIAQKIYDLLVAKIKLGQWHPELMQQEERKNYTFKELAEKYLDWCKGRQKSFDVKRYIIAKLVERFGSMEIDSFNNLTIEQLQSDYISKNYTNAYINKVTSVLKHMLTKASDWNMATELTLKSIRKAKPLTGENKRLRYLSKEECQALINACDPHLRPIVITALKTGMRKSEILNLKWQNIDLKHGFILLDRTKNGERREIPINDTLRTVFQSITRRLDVPYVFYNPTTGKPYTKDLKRSFQTACKKAGIRDFHFHDLRHTFASHLVMAGVDLTTVKELLGHKDIKMTLRYAHLAPSHKVEAVKKLGYFLSVKTVSKSVQHG